MKKRIALFLMLAVAMFSLSGCDTDDDADTAYFFEGYWEGQMGTNFYDELGYGTDYHYTQLDIVRTNKYGGYGTERDYNSRRHYTAIGFNWTVDNGHIYFKYDNGKVIALDFRMEGTYSDNVRMLMKAYDYETGDVIGTAELYKIDNWYDNWYDNSYWSKPNTLQGSKEE